MTWRLGPGVPLGEHALRFALPEGADPPALLGALRAVPGVIDAIVTDAWVAITFADEPPRLDREIDAAPLPPAQTHVVDVRYDGADLDEVARSAGLSLADVVRIHAEAQYRVLFVGFAPGFAYLGGLDERLRCPRRASPRPRVPAGTVAIAEGYAAIYPAASPGGWNLLGTALNTPVLLLPGDLVRFCVA